MASAADYLSQASDLLLTADDLEAHQDRNGAFWAALAALAYTVMAIAVELGVPPPATNGQPTRQIPGQGTLPV